MIRYKYDQENKYLDDIYLHLRKHNESFTGPKAKEELYFYIKSNQKIRGAIKVGLSWDWVSISSAYYENLNVLKAMMKACQNYFKGHGISGIKLYTESLTRFQDFKEIGFVEPKVVDTIIRPWYYLNLYDPIEESSNYIVKHTSDEKDVIEFLKQQTIEFHKKENIVTDYIEKTFVALDGEVFVGGVVIEIYPTSIYTHLLAVNKDYRGKKVGLKLMEFPEKEAKERNIKMLEVGTAEFQAKPFYEKLDYKVVYTRKDNPKGYECYTLVKTLEE